MTFSVTPEIDTGKEVPSTRESNDSFLETPQVTPYLDDSSSASETTVASSRKSCSSFSGPVSYMQSGISLKPTGKVSVSTILQKILLHMSRNACSWCRLMFGVG